VPVEERALHVGLGLAVGPEGVGEGRVEGDAPVARGLLVRRRGGDEDVLADVAAKDFEVGLDLLGGVGEELADDVEALGAEGAVGGVVELAADGTDAGRQGFVTLAAVEDGDVVTGAGAGLDAGVGDLAGAADVEDFCQSVTLTSSRG
jgi:hypothetical protein